MAMGLPWARLSEELRIRRFVELAARTLGTMEKERGVVPLECSSHHSKVEQVVQLAVARSQSKSGMECWDTMAQRSGCSSEVHQGTNCFLIHAAIRTMQQLAHQSHRFLRPLC
jgi:pyruvate kinase